MMDAETLAHLRDLATRGFDVECGWLADAVEEIDRLRADGPEGVAVADLFVPNAPTETIRCGEHWPEVKRNCSVCRALAGEPGHLIEVLTDEAREARALAVEVLAAMEQDCGPVDAEPWAGWAKALAQYVVESAP